MKQEAIQEFLNQIQKEERPTTKSDELKNISNGNNIQDTSALSKKNINKQITFNSSEFVKTTDANKSLFESSLHFKAFKSNESLLSSSKLSKVFDVNKSLFESSALSKVFESNESLLSSSELSKSFNVSKSLINTSAFSKAFESNERLLSSSKLNKAFNVSKSLIYASTLSKTFESNKVFLESTELSGVFEFGKELINTSVFTKTFESTKKLFDNKYFNKTLFNLNLITELSNAVVNFREHFDKFKTIDINNIQLNFNISETELSLVSVEGSTLKINEKKYELAEINQIVNDVLSKSGISSIDEKLNESFAKLFQIVSALSDKMLNQIVYNIIIQLLLGILLIITTPKINELSERYIYQNPKPIVKKIVNITKNSPLNFKIALIDYRYITVNILNVRALPSQKSKIIGKLYLGYLVKFIKKKKKWMLVEYRNDELDIVLLGWVFSRYSKKFK